MAIVWFLDRVWIYMALVAAALAASVHLICAIVTAVRVGRSEGIAYVIFAPIYTFVSCLFYVIVLAISAGYTYAFLDANPEFQYTYWSIGFGILYILLKMFIVGGLR